MNELVPVQAVRSPDVNDTLALAKILAGSGFFGDARDVAQAAAKILAGMELNIGAVAAMVGLFIIKGRISLSANLIASLIRRSRRYDYRVLRLDNEACEIEFFKDGKSQGVSAFTLEDARKAGLANGDNWRKYPRNMLFARAMSNGARWYCPDVFGGPVYTPDELGASVDAEEGTVVAVSPEPVKVVPAKVTINREQQGELEQLLQRKGADAAKLLSYYEVGSLNDLTPEQHAHAVELLYSRPDVSQGPQSTVLAGDQNTNQDRGE